MTDDWKTTGIHEFDNHYIIIGSGFTGYPNYDIYINFNKLEKEGTISDVWQYPFEVTRTIDMRNQQSLSVLGNKKVLGITSSTAGFSGDLYKSAHLILNDEMTAVVDSSWVHPTNENAFTYNILQHSDKVLSSLVTQDPNNLSDTKFRFIATNSTGILLWQNDYICPDDCWTYRPQHILSTQDGGYLLTADEQRSPPPSGIPTDHEVSTLIKTDSLGEFEWQIYPGGVGMPYTSNDILAVATDDGHILCAWTDRRKLRETDMSYQQNEDRTIWFAKIDLEGNKIWEKNIKEYLTEWHPRNYSEIYQMISLSDDNIAISTRGLIIKITQDADVIWIRDAKPPLFQPPNVSEFSFVGLYGIVETSDGGFLCTGEAQLLPGDAFPEFEQTGFVIKVDEHGCLDEGCQLVDVEEVVEEENNTLLIYPNPTSHDITVNYQLPHTPDQLTLAIYNITGRAIHTHPLLPTHEGSVRIELDKNLPVGAYFCHLVADEQVIGVERFVLMR